MAATIGRVLLMPKGNYSGTTAYNALDWVRYNGTAWVCTTDNTIGVIPAVGVPEWQVLAQDGAVTGSVDWSNVNFKPFDDIKSGGGLTVDGSNHLELDTSYLTGSNVSYDNTVSGLSAADVQAAIDEIAGSSTDVSWNQIQTSTGATKIAEITIDGTKTDVYSPSGGGGGGLLPYFYIDSEAGATVTVTAPDGSTITPTAAGSGHWECSVPMYGTYTIHSVLAGQGDATASVTVDDVKEYHITDNHYDFTINVTAPSGSTIRITGGGETYTGTGTGSSQAFAVHTASTTYTVAVTMDGNTKTDTITSAATTGGSGSVSIEFGTITVNVDAAFVSAGSTITCVNGGTSCTPKTAASTLVFRVPTTGTWTISGSVSGTPYSVDATVTSLGTPESVALQTTQSVTVTLYSATEDTVSFTDASGIPRTEVFGTNQSSKTVSIAVMPSGSSITFTSGVALDPDNLDGSHYYSKTVTVTTATTDIYIMPDHVLYWYGYEDTTLTGGNNFAGWTSSVGGVTVGNGTANKNSYTCGGAAAQMNGYGTVNKIDITSFNSLKIILASVTGSNYKCFLQASNNKSTITGLDATPLSPQPAARILSVGLGTLDISSYSGDYGIANYAYHTDTNTMSALWLE